MIPCRTTLDPTFTRATVPPRLFGTLVEHMGRCVYGGVFEPGHAESDVDGNRLDVLKLSRELGVSVVRYPGGNFVSGYRWEDGVGPLDQRPTRLNLAWNSAEPNTFGLNEFMSWCRQLGAEPMMAVNLGTRGVEDACNLVEYANHPGGTYWSDLRRSHGVEEPYGITLWCLGNEMDGPWQIGHKTADEYGQLAAQTARAMRMVDPTIELVACGSSTPQMPTFGTWEATVLQHTYDVVDYISVHAYFTNDPDDRPGWLASAVAMDSFIEGIIATADHVAAVKQSRRRLKISFDEWNVWYDDKTPAEGTSWVKDPRLIEETYDVEDAVVVGSLLMSLLRHADRVGVAAFAQLVNVIAPIRAEADGSAWRQTIFYPLSLTARYARGHILHTQTHVASIDTVDTATLGEVPAADVVATHDAENGTVTVFALNRHETEPVSLELNVSQFGNVEVLEHTVLGGVDLDGTNSRQAPERVVPWHPAQTDQAAHVKGTVRATLPPVSWTMLRLTVSRAQ